MKKIIFLLFFVAVIVFQCPIYSWAEEIEIIATGMSSLEGCTLEESRNIAIKDALEKAVEQGVGVVIDSTTQISNFINFENEILSKTKGYVKRYTIISEGSMPSTNAYNVQVRATVDTVILSDDLRAIGILIEQFDNPRIAVAYVPRDHELLSVRNSSVIRGVGNTITDVFQKSGFVVVDAVNGDVAYRRVENHECDISAVERLLRSALSSDADIIICYNVKILNLEAFSNDYQQAVNVGLEVKAVNISTIELMTRASADVDLTISKNGSPYSNGRCLDGALDIIDHISDPFFERFLAHCGQSVHDGRTYQVTFENIDSCGINGLKTAMESVKGVGELYIRSWNDFSCRIDVKFAGGKSDFVKKVTEVMGQSANPCYLKEVNGDCFTFSH